MPIATDKLLHQIVSRLRLRHLPLLLALERQRSVSRVAAEMNLSQPAVTKALREIEDIFMTPLFTRTRNGLEPTATGAAVLSQARMTLADAEALGRQLAVIEAGRRGRLRLGVIPYTARAVLDAALAYGLNQQPRLSVVVREGTTDELVGALRQHELDCAIARSFYLAGEDIVQEPLYREEPVLVVPSRARARLSRGDLDWKRLAELDWILPPPHTPVRRTINTMFAVAGVAPPLPIVETYSIKPMATLLRSQPDAITIVPRAVAAELIELGDAATLPFSLSWDLPPVGVMWRRESEDNDLMKPLVAALKAAVS
ncbi:DNA-binding transcriptional regulator, LysR family [Ralstonia sp. 25mfcol4.1]|uniref:LysR family transcriptional regulator n=1 Tax=Burkholderiaceae TaxID=119060 RepID=UPI00088325F4|nr:LysR substrate-binding domain-containing protein [Ralstonia sp. 25mfcol4.1]SDP71255.1 DNA-binding transcriptional regulator, LysR family [Ralstonia sp. 25mfcol4.1]